MSDDTPKKSWFGRTKYFFEIITLDDDENVHTYHRSNDLFFTYKDKTSEKEITREVEPKDLFELVQNPVIHFVIWLLTGIHKHYYVVLDKTGESIRPFEPDVNAVILKSARDWKGLNPAFKDMFKGRFGELKGNAIFVIGALVIIFLVWLVYTGRINIPGVRFR